MVAVMMVVVMVMLQPVLGVVIDGRGRVVRVHGHDELAVLKVLLDTMGVMMLGLLTMLMKLMLKVSVLAPTTTTDPVGNNNIILVRAPSFAHSLVPVAPTTTRRQTWVH
ncbi:hypothetical protein BC830DRAFT_1110477 [Chytriomyces sp. MP71]|nr:hypothetical protein BC830DRAFT_1110477 [Chytriomyces sp. MP71]